MSARMKIMAILVARAGQADALRDLLFGMAPACRAEPGNLRWDVWRDPAEPARFVLDELYVDADAVAAHRETPHFKAYLSRINDLAERTSLLLEPAAVA
ncbi:putative quinol monooxygenase [Brevundimonas sp.]|uniref:putative quinol monooxygenase n=1 Tax=Brevundimonas sp. TaxID=1871086 RepID=UPI003F723F26